jgi:glucan biosynthesis protein C
MKDKTRLYYLDNIKIFLIIIVIIHHVGQAYGATGGSWFYSYPGERVGEMGLFFLFNASYFMGLFFFISGYFFPISYDRHGPKKFITDKVMRFGIPAAFGLFVMIPILEYAKYIHYTNRIGFIVFYVKHWLGYDPNAIIPHGWQLNFAHLWFIEQLLLWAVIYLLFRVLVDILLRGRVFPSPKRIRWYAILIFILLLGIVTELMRNPWGFPMDKWIGFLGFIQMEPAHIPQYVSYFILGILVSRWKLIGELSSRRNIVWVFFAVTFFAVNCILNSTVGPRAMFEHWEMREALFSVGFCIGLIALFRFFANRTNRLLAVLSSTAFGAYIIHVPVVVALQYAFDPVAWGPDTLFSIVSVLSVPLSFLFAWGLKQIPGVPRVI